MAVADSNPNAQNTLPFQTGVRHWPLMGSVCCVHVTPSGLLTASGEPFVSATNIAYTIGSVTFREPMTR